MSKLWMRRRSTKTSKVVPTMKTLVVAPAGTPTRSISTETCGTPTSPFDGQPFRLGYLCAEPLVWRSSSDGSLKALPPVQRHQGGELALLKNDVRSASVVTISDVKLLRITRASFETALGGTLEALTHAWKVQLLQSVSIPTWSMSLTSGSLRTPSLSNMH